jgi:hypothetical protein
MEPINYESENILILALAGSILSGAWLAYQLKLFKFFSTINDEKKILLPSFLFLISPFLLPFIFSHNMLPQSPGVYIVLSAIVSGIMLIASNFINNQFQLEREKQQSIRQQENDHQKWYREKIYDCYRTSIQVLTKIVQGRHEMNTKSIFTEDEHIALEKLYHEFNSEFAIIIAGYPNKESEEFIERMADIRKYMQEKPLIARIIITEMMEHDSRIKNVSR